MEFYEPSVENEVFSEMRGPVWTVGGVSSADLLATLADQQKYNGKGKGFEN